MRVFVCVCIFVYICFVYNLHWYGFLASTLKWASFHFIKKRLLYRKVNQISCEGLRFVLSIPIFLCEFLFGFSIVLLLYCKRSDFNCTLMDLAVGRWLNFSAIVERFFYSLIISYRWHFSSPYCVVKTVLFHWSNWILPSMHWCVVDVL